MTAAEITVTARKAIHVATPGRYAHVAVRPVTDYTATVDGVMIENRSLAALKQRARVYARRAGATKVTFVVVEVAE